MKLSLNTSVAASGGVQMLSRNVRSAFRSFQKTTSGLAINSAADDPAGLVISERLRTRIASLNQEIENTTNNIFAHRVAASTVDGLRSGLQQIRSLAVAAANGGGNSPEAQASYARAAGDLVTRFNDAVKASKYNGIKLVKGIESALGDLPLLEDVDLSSPKSAEDAIAIVDDAMQQLDDTAVRIGSTIENDLESRLASLETERQNLLAAESVIRDTDYAVELSNLVRSRISVQVSAALLSHSALNGEAVLGLLNNR